MSDDRAPRRRDVVVRRFTDDDVPAAGRLLAERHARHARAQPLLGPGGTDPHRARSMVRELWSSPGADGVVAVLGAGAGAEVVGYLVGTARSGPAWGPNAWVEAAGHAARSPDAVAPLYAAASARWVAEGRTAHYALVPAHDAAVLAAWDRLGFGQQQVHAIRPTDPSLDPPAGVGVVVRPATADDVEALARLELVLAEHQAGPPVFSAAPVPTVADVVEELRTTWSDERFPTFVAVASGDVGTVLGATTCCRLEESSKHTGPARPDDAALLAFAAVFPEHRGRRVAAALTRAALQWSREQGCGALVTDWRSTNLLSSRTWPALGFAETFRRLHRSVGY